jgi:hypothetical protein
MASAAKAAAESESGENGGEAKENGVIEISMAKSCLSAAAANSLSLAKWLKAMWRKAESGGGSQRRRQSKR